MRHCRRMKLRLDYGTAGLFAEFPDDRVAVIEPVHVPAATDPSRILTAALQRPIGKAPLRELVRPGRRIAIQAGTSTGPSPRKLFLKPLFPRCPGVGFRMR